MAAFSVYIVGVFVLVMIAMSFFSFRWAVHQRRLAHAFMSATITAIDDVRSGFVKLKGTVRQSGPALVARFSQRPCVYYQCDVYDKEYQSAGAPPHGFRKQWREVRSGSFIIEDETGSIIVRANQAYAVLEPKRTWSLDARLPHVPVLRIKGHSGPLRTLEHGIRRADDREWQMGDRRFTERTIEPGDVVYVFGWYGEDERGPFITGHPSIGRLAITDREDADLVSKLRSSANTLLGVGIFFVVCGLFGTIAIVFSL